MNSYDKYAIRSMFDRKSEQDNAVLLEAIERLEKALGKKAGICRICCNVEVLDDGLCCKCVNYRVPFNGKPYMTMCGDCGMRIETNITDSIQAVHELLRDGWHDSREYGWLCPECAGLL